MAEIMQNDVINLLYYEYWIDKQKYFHVLLTLRKKCLYSELF